MSRERRNHLHYGWSGSEMTQQYTVFEVTVDQHGQEFTYQVSIREWPGKPVALMRAFNVAVHEHKLWIPCTPVSFRKL